LQRRATDLRRRVADRLEVDVLGGVRLEVEPVKRNHGGYPEDNGGVEDDQVRPVADVPGLHKVGVPALPVQLDGFFQSVPANDIYISIIVVRRTEKAVSTDRGFGRKGSLGPCLKARGNSL
jgi:hypothetical protein